MDAINDLVWCWFHLWHRNSKIYDERVQSDKLIYEFIAPGNNKRLARERSQCQRCRESNSWHRSSDDGGIDNVDKTVHLQTVFSHSFFSILSLIVSFRIYIVGANRCDGCDDDLGLHVVRRGRVKRNSSHVVSHYDKWDNVSFFSIFCRQIQFNAHRWNDERSDSPLFHTLNGSGARSFSFW